MSGDLLYIFPPSTDLIQLPGQQRSHYDCAMRARAMAKHATIPHTRLFSGKLYHRALLTSIMSYATILLCPCKTYCAMCPPQKMVVCWTLGEAKSWPPVLSCGSLGERFSDGSAAAATAYRQVLYER